MSEANPPKRRKARLTARALVIHQDHVLMLKGYDGDGNYWYVIPGGGVEMNERLQDAIVREMDEETGIRVEVGELAYIREFIPERHPGRSKFMPVHNHVVAMIFTARPCPVTYKGIAREEIGKFPGDADGTGAIVDMEWLPLNEIANFDLRPPHLKEALAKGFPPQGIEFWPEENDASGQGPESA